MSRAFFIRHAETDMAGRFCGHSDPELNARGYRQLTDLINVLAEEPINSVYSSDLRRAKSTASAIAMAKQIPYHVTSALREIDFGGWEGLTWNEIELRDPTYARRWVQDYPNLPAPDGETFAAFEARILDEVHRLLQSADSPIAIVTHAGALRVILRHFFGCTEETARERTKDYCSILRYENEGSVAVVRETPA